MHDIKGSKTEKNLLESFAGESQANRKYLAFAKQADKEGKHQIAKLFRAAAEAETVHAHNHLRVLGEIRSTAENLKEDPRSDLSQASLWVFSFCNIIGIIKAKIRV